ncbi:NADH:flavin oxidoreductase/NADH oxidase [Amylostereum chailletii]|nr:NADH:flavin oxidoreductase/NADH oxidase [Amylostereum chailletii]
MALSTLFQPYKLGRINLQHRVIMPALTRNRADRPTHVVGDAVVEHYAQRAAVPGTLLTAEATHIAQQDAGLPWRGTPGIWSDDQIAGWKKVVDTVHAKGSFIYCQLWTVGRLSDPDILASIDPSFPYLSAGDIPYQGYNKAPRPMTRDEIKQYVQYYADAARNAVEKAGFDGVEIGGAGGYHLDEFLKNYANNRTDEYNGPPENKARFSLKIVDAVVDAVGADRVGIKLSPWATLPGFDNGVKPDDPRPVFGYLVREIRARHPDFSYIHVLEPRVSGNFVREVRETESNDFLREIWRGKTYIANGGYTRESAMKEADEHGSLVSFGRLYTSNPDLPTRLEYDMPLTPYDRSTFYTEGSPEGYNVYSFAEESKAHLVRRGVRI